MTVSTTRKAPVRKAVVGARGAAAKAAPQIQPGILAEVGGLLDDGLVVADADARVISANSSAVRFFGEGLVGADLADVFPLDDVRDIVAGKADERGFSYSKPGSVAMEFKVRAKRMDDGHILVIVLDMTLQRNLEKVRRDFVANVSHELRSPLTSLAGFIETILTNDVRDWPTQRRFLGIMQEEAGRMSRLVDDLLSLSRVEVDEHIVPDQTVPLVEVVNTVIASLESRAAKRGMRIMLKDGIATGANRGKAAGGGAGADRAGRLVMHGFSDEINEVFHNLIENAIKYGTENTMIKVEIMRQGAHSVVISVVNSGEPIAERHISRLTERFYRVDKARSRQIGGTGLGLAIVKHIVNRHRGTMEISSASDGVTRVAVTLPVIG